MAGVIPTREALGLAQQHQLDLVEVSPNADPPVCRIMDFGKFRYDESVRRKKAKQSQHRTQLKEVKFHANVDEHDYQTKLNKIHKFLEKGDKVKVTLQFRGRENAHRELGFELVNRVVSECEELASVEMQPKLVGRAVVCMLGTKSAKAN
jgi:translation initiation factor IF-3